MQSAVGVRHHRNISWFIHLFQSQKRTKYFLNIYSNFYNNIISRMNESYTTSIHYYSMENN